ncbi:class I SAM-dependent methyltransferase [Shewanella gaetbuli]|uniref:Class I SAM-dependent methyltransferase n=1 Tax=Shewanella gaetbuli TaxID=220752 RepID=A0A9X1ZMY3_9GAMM|nr:class I SAM-dependent methyltransferase [Shewanella gaetbuli]MCL1142860.1 class I SAM-dependent methyltransferase [Shewanella gaetbuli]
MSKRPPQPPVSNTSTATDLTDNCPDTCPLCESTRLGFFHQDKNRPYFQCQQCQLVTVPKAFYLDEVAEKAFYDLHDNTVADEGYKRFLSRTLTPVLERVNSEAKGLDFGCGEGGVLSQMAAEAGVSVSNYDLFYFPDTGQLKQQYDFITMTEVIEHIADAKGVLQQLKQLLNDNGLIAIMTKRVRDHASFINWHYKHDPTHINFYSEATFQWIAVQYQWQLEVVDNDVVIFSQQAQGSDTA